jgi:lipopolysaccharide heptosyltransferase I
MINGVPRILIIRFSAIGDVVRVLPALHALRDRYPHAQIDWAVEPKALEVISGHPALDHCLVFERPGGLAGNIRAFQRFCREIRDRHYDLVLDFHGVFKSGWLMRASRARERYGFAPPRGRELSYIFANRRVRLPSSRMNRIEENLELCRALEAKSHSLEVTIDVPEEVQDEVDAYMHATFDAGKKLAIIHPPVDRPEKQWPLERFAALADMILADGRYEVLLTWGPGQRPVVEKVHTLARRRPEIAPETSTLKHFAWLVSRADLFFGGDTGPMHIASAMGVPVAAVFGGTDPARHAPIRPPCEVLYAGPPDPPRNVPLRDARDYLERIDAETAYDACIRLLTH